MTEKIGHMLLIDLLRPEGEAVTKIDAAVTDQIQRIKPCGVILYGVNIVTLDQTWQLIRDLQSISPIPLFIAVDHEGGVVNRFDDSGEIQATEIPSAADIGRTGNQNLAFRIAKVAGGELSAMGFNMNFAPVADILANENSVIGSRSFGKDPLLVSQMTQATVRGLQSKGVSSVIKHFPGHGTVAGDTHSGSVYSDSSVGDLSTEGFLPFRAGIDAGADGIMTAHVALSHENGEVLTRNPFTPHTN